MKPGATIPPKAIDQGIVGGYTYDPLVLTQYETCVKLSPRRMFAYIAQLDQTEQRVREETLVKLARDFSHRSLDVIAWKLIQLLCDRVSLSLGRTVRLWRLTPSDAEEVISAALANLYNSVLDTSDKAKFWEIRFWVCFDRFLLTTVKSHRTVVDKTIQGDLSGAPESAVVDSVRNKDQDWRDPSLRAVVSEALSQLPENLRTAFMLKHWAGLSESSRDPNDQTTIASIMGVTDRTVRNYLYRAETILNHWRTGSGQDRKDQVG